MLLSGKVSGTFEGEMPSARWAALRVAIINAFNDAVSAARDSVAAFDDLEALSAQVTEAVAAEVASLGGGGRVVIQAANLDAHSQELLDQRRASGPAAPDAFLIGASGVVGPPPAAPPLGAGAEQFVPGGPVLVRWNDGNHYPGTVVQVAADQCLVALADGREMWLGIEWLLPR